MKNYLFPLFFLVNLIGCHAQPPQKSGTMEDKKVQNKNIGIKRTSMIISKLNDSIFVKLAVTAFSKDSVIVQSTFVNNTHQGFYLYKLLLPADELLKESVFGFSVEDEFKGMPPEINFIDLSESQYYEGSRRSGNVIPELKPDNFILLEPMSSLKFTINVAKFYDLQSKVTAGFKHFSIVYGANMPLINNRIEQIFEKEKKDGKLKPVFTFIVTPKANKTDKYLSQRAYFTIK